MGQESPDTRHPLGFNFQLVACTPSIDGEDKPAAAALSVRGLLHIRGILRRALARYYRMSRAGVCMTPTIQTIRKRKMDCSPSSCFSAHAPPWKPTSNATDQTISTTYWATEVQVSMAYSAALAQGAAHAGFVSRTTRNA